MKNIIKFLKNNWFYLLIFIAFFILCMLFPYTGDDWAWGTKIGIDRLNSWFADYNGRYAGNLLVLLITRSKIVRSIFESGFFALIVYFINKIVNKNNNKIGLVFITMLLLMPLDIFRESVSWASGFSNYVPPIAFLLMYISQNNYLFAKDIKKQNKKGILSFIIFLLVGFAGALFIENLTIYACILAVFVCFYEFIKTKKVSTHNIGFLIGTIIGTAIMFSNGAYHMISNGTDTYRTVEQGNIIVRCIRTYMETLNRHIFYNNFILGLVLSSIVLIILYQMIKTNKKKTTKFFAYIAMMCTSLYLMNNIFLKLYGSPITRKLFSNALNAGTTILFSLALLFIFIYGIKKVETRKKLIFYLATIVLTNLPLLVVTPIGSRLFLSNYIFLCLIVLELMNEYLNIDEIIANLFKIGSTIAICFLLAIFIQINNVQKATEKYIEKHRDDKVIKLPQLPYDGFMHSACPNKNRVFNTRYKIYYGINEKSVVDFIDLKTWQKENKTASK